MSDRLGGVFLRLFSRTNTRIENPAYVVEDFRDGSSDEQRKNILMFEWSK